MDVEQFGSHLFKALHAKISRSSEHTDINQIVDFTTKLESHFFRFYDSNRDGFIDFGEFLLVYFMLAEGTQEDVFKRVFCIYDQNADGTISKQEMSKLINDMYDVLKMKDDTKESEKELVDSVYAESDVNNDGFVSIDEFIGACRRRGNLTKLLTNKMLDIFKSSDGEQLLSLTTQ